MNICIVSPSFPTPKTIDFVFVEQLCFAFSDLGVKVMVVAPQSITKCVFRKIPIVPVHSFSSTKNNNKIEIYRPYALTFGTCSINKYFDYFNRWLFARCIHKMKNKPDVFYGHFWESIYRSYPFAKKMGVPLFGASGEEDVKYYINKKKDYIDQVSSYLCGIINVSKKNHDECINMGLVPKEKTIIIPNAIDSNLFRLMDKIVMRKKLGFSENDFIVAFVGQFVSRKGVMRLSEALSYLNDPKIKAFFIGDGVESPQYDGILYKGLVKHEKLPEYLNCADVFVLPTENEGCSNAIIEAMACGLPIISTDAPFNYDILNESNSILVDCHNIEQLGNAIRELKSNTELRQNLAEGALKEASKLTIDVRASKILEFIESKK